jgi:hypothetical protein
MIRPAMRAERPMDPRLRGNDGGIEPMKANKASFLRKQESICLSTG